MTTSLNLDPGLLHPAVAIFTGGRLQAAERVKVPASLARLNMGQRCLDVARLVYDAVSGLQIDELVVEWPKVYRGAKSKGDPADLIPLAGIGMALAGMLGVPVISVEPREWLGGNMPKITSGDPRESIRGEYIWSRLDEEERTRIQLTHDSFDSCGIGLWRAGRFGKRRVYAR